MCQPVAVNSLLPRIWTNWRWPVSSVVYVRWKEPGQWHFNQWNGRGRKWRWIHPTIMFLGRGSNFLFWDLWKLFFFIKGSFDHPWTSVTLPTYPTRGAHEKLFHFIPMAVRHFSSADVDGPTELQSGSGCVQSVGALAPSSEDSEGIWQIGVQGFTGWLTASFFGFPRA